MISSEVIFGAFAAIFCIVCIIHAAIGICRGQLNTYGTDGVRRGQHGHKAVREGIFPILVGVASLLCGIYMLLSGVVHA
jgi:hypothetical protein